MKKDTEKTKVVFYVENNEADKVPDNALAVFPEIITDRKGNLLCYAHLGQHSAAAPDYVKELRPATPAEYADLKSELESIGYNLEVMNLLEIATR